MAPELGGAGLVEVGVRAGERWVGGGKPVKADSAESGLVECFSSCEAADCLGDLRRGSGWVVDVTPSGPQASCSTPSLCCTWPRKLTKSGQYRCTPPLPQAVGVPCGNGPYRGFVLS